MQQPLRRPWHPTGFGSLYAALESHGAGRPRLAAIYLPPGKRVPGTFILLGKGGKVSTNRPQEQQASVLGLHPLQVCLVHVNILTIRRLLAEPERSSRMTPRDLWALTLPDFPPRQPLRRLRAGQRRSDTHRSGDRLTFRAARRTRTGARWRETQPPKACGSGIG
jgi:hypothetical protein